MNLFLKGLLPTAAERPIIYELSLAIQDMFRVVNLNFTPTAFPTTEMPTEREGIIREITEPTLETDLGMELDPYLPHYKHPMRRQIDFGTEFEDQTILLALRHENSCNPVLRASAKAILER